MKSHVVSAREWDAAREKLLAKEKEMTRARDALAAERRRMPWQAVEKNTAVVPVSNATTSNCPKVRACSRMKTPLRF